MIFKIQTTHTWLRASAFVLMLVGWVLGFYMIANIARDYSESATRKNSITILQPVNDTLFVSVLRDSMYNEYDWNNNFGVRMGKKWHVNGSKDNFVMNDNIHFDIEKALGDKFELVESISSRGRTEEDAFQNTIKVNYNFEQKDSLLLLSDIYPLPVGERYRGQKVRLTLKVPVGKSVFLADDTKSILSDVNNVTNTWDGDMVNYTWTMTDKGLKCIGCNLKGQNWDENNLDEDAGNQSTNIKIDSTGIQISTDKDTIVSKNVNINVSEKGIQINTGNDKKK